MKKQPGERILTAFLSARCRCIRCEHEEPIDGTPCMFKRCSCGGRMRRVVIKRSS